MARGFTAFGLVLVVAGIGAYWRSRPEPIPPVVGVVRSTEVLKIVPPSGSCDSALREGTKVV